MQELGDSCKDIILSFLSEKELASFLLNQAWKKCMYNYRQKAHKVLSINYRSADNFKRFIACYAKNNVEKLHILFSNIDDENLELISKSFPKLISLNIEIMKNSEGLTDNGIEHLVRGMPQLKTLRLLGQGSNVSKESFSLILSSLPNLSYIHVDFGDNCTDELLLESLDKLNTYEHFSINSQNLTDKSILKLCELNKVEFLDISGCSIKLSFFTSLLNYGKANMIKGMAVDFSHENEVYISENGDYRLSAIKSILQFPKIKTLDMLLWDDDSTDYLSNEINLMIATDFPGSGFEIQKSRVGYNLSIIRRQVTSQTVPSS